MNALIAVAKRPTPGETKTRLTPPLSAEQAAALFECFLRDTLDLMRQAPSTYLALAYLPESEAAYFRRIAPGIELVPQSGEDLGTRLDNATRLFLERGCEKVVIIDSDSPTLPVETLVQAFESLTNDTDVVIGPCDDGGYYLIGCKRPISRLLRGVHMSTSQVTAETLTLAAEEGLKTVLLPPWYDIDTAEDLARLVKELESTETASAAATRHFLESLDWREVRGFKQASEALPWRVAVIIPALNEAGNIRDLIQEVQAVSIPGVEISTILVDNGSTDGTAAEARAAGAKVVEEPRRGYGYACLAGAAATQADVLVFLDGDHSSSPAEMHVVLQPILDGQADLVIGSRELGGIASGAMPPHQRMGNRLSTWLMNRLYHLSMTDLGPYRAVQREVLIGLEMREMTYGWTAEMTVKAARNKTRLVEVPVHWYNRRAGQSKVSGTLRGSFLAAWFILGVTLRYAWGKR